MSLIEFDVWTAPYDLSASPDARLSTDDSLTDAGFNPVLYGEGDGFLEIHIDDPDTQYLQRRAFVRAVRTDTEEPIFDFILEEADTRILAKDSADKVIRWSGRGALYLLDRYRLGQAVYAPDQPNRGSVSVIDYWTWINISPGGILRRVWEEGFYHPDDFYANTTVDFDRVTDSQDETWIDLTDYQTRIGTSGLQVTADMMRMGLMVRARPVPDSVQFQAFKDLSFRTDRTSATFTDGKVRFEGGVNVAVELPQKIAALRERTHTLTRRKDGQYATETVNGSGEPYMDFKEVPFTSDPDAVEAFVGAHHLNLQKQSLVAVVQHRIDEVVSGGGAGANGYFPSIDGHYWNGDLVTVHTGSGEYDLTEQPLEVAGIRYFLRGADWMVECQLGAQAMTASGGVVLPVAGPSTVVTPQIELCQADAVGGGSETCWDGQDGAHTEVIPAFMSQPEVTTAAWENPASGPNVGDYFWRFSFSGDYAYFPDKAGAGEGWYALAEASPGDTIAVEFMASVDSGTNKSLWIQWLSGDYDGTGSGWVVEDEEEFAFTEGTIAGPAHNHVFGPAPAGTVAYRFANHSSTWNLHSLCISTEGVSFEGNGPESLVGTAPRAARCDHNHLAENLATAESDTALVLKPDGEGGVAWGEDDAGGVTEITDLPTAETDTALVLKPDGAGGVEWGTDDTGSGSSSFVGYQTHAFPILAPSSNTGAAGVASTAYMFPIVLTGPMKVRGFRVRFTSANAGSIQFGLFKMDTVTSATKVIGVSSAPPGTGWRTLTVSGAPVDVPAGAYVIIMHQPSSNPSNVGTTDYGSGWGAKSQASYTWDDTPNLTSGWSDYQNTAWVGLIGDMDASGNQW